MCLVPRHLSLDKDLRPNVRVSPFFFLLSVVPCASSQVTRGRRFRWPLGENETVEAVDSPFAPCIQATTLMQKLWDTTLNT